MHATGLRSYTPELGRWINRDPVGEDGGLNIYGFVRNSPISGLDHLGLRDVISRVKWAKDWIKRNPNAATGLTPEEKKMYSKRLMTIRDRGCIGLTCIELGVYTPNLNNCYKKKAQAEKRQQEMIKNKECCSAYKNLNGDPSKPRIFSVHLWNDKGGNEKYPDVNFDSASGKADMDNWDYEPRPGRGYIRFDFGYLAGDGKIVHANHFHDPDGSLGIMKIYRSTIAEWKKSYSDFNTEVWCVACQRDDIKP